jgi:hypothetical protein
VRMLRIIEAFVGTEVGSRGVPRTLGRS